jgi:mRNA interferase MazF
MVDPADVVIVSFPGARLTKTRPAVVISTALYHGHRPDLIVGLLTTQVSQASQPTDCVLQDWSSAGLHRPTAFRSYLLTVDRTGAVSIGRVSQRDWQSIQSCLRLALDI